MKRTGRLFAMMAVVAVGVGLAEVAEASFVPIFRETVAAGENTEYLYDLVFSTTEIPGTPAEPVERLETGNFLTFFDIDGLMEVTTPVGLSAEMSYIGLGRFMPIPDDANGMNVTFTYTGSEPLTEDTTFRVSFISSIGQTVAREAFGSTTTMNTGPTAGTTIQHTGVTVVPVPEPAALALLGLGGTAALAVFRRRRSAA